MACGNIRHVAMGAEVDAGKYGVRQYKTCGNGYRGGCASNLVCGNIRHVGIREEVDTGK